MTDQEDLIKFVRENLFHQLVDQDVVNVARFVPEMERSPVQPRNCLFLSFDDPHF